MDVGELHDAQAVESCGQAVGADLGLFDAERRTALRSAANQHDGDGGAQDQACLRPAQGVEEKVADPRKHGDHPRPEHPHGPKNVGRGVVAQGDSGERRGDGQRIGERGPRDEKDASVAGRSLALHAAVMVHVGGNGDESQHDQQGVQYHIPYLIYPHRMQTRCRNSIRCKGKNFWTTSPDSFAAAAIWHTSC